MHNNDLKNLILKIGGNQDKQAFTEIFDYFAPRVIGYLVKSGSNQEIAEEIAQEVLSVVWLKSNKFDYKRGNVSTWIYTIARNKRIDRFRKNTNVNYNSDDLIDALYSAENRENQDIESRIREMQSKLNENEKKLIRMNFFEGKSHKNISQDLEIPLGTVKSRIRNILIKMKNS